MSSPNFGFSPWRRRASSLSSQRNNESNPENPLLSPGRNSQLASADRLSSSVSSHREPIRSFIHGTLRDHLGKQPPAGAIFIPDATANS